MNVQGKNYSTSLKHSAVEQNPKPIDDLEPVLNKQWKERQKTPLEAQEVDLLRNELETLIGDPTRRDAIAKLVDAWPEQLIPMVLSRLHGETNELLKSEVLLSILLAPAPAPASEDLRYQEKRAAKLVEAAASGDSPSEKLAMVAAAVKSCHSPSIEQKYQLAGIDGLVRSALLLNKIKEMKVRPGGASIGSREKEALQKELREGPGGSTAIAKLVEAWPEQLIPMVVSCLLDTPDDALFTVRAAILVKAATSVNPPIEGLTMIADALARRYSRASSTQKKQLVEIADLVRSDIVPSNKQTVRDSKACEWILKTLPEESVESGSYASIIEKVNAGEVSAAIESFANLPDIKAQKIDRRSFSAYLADAATEKLKWDCGIYLVGKNWQGMDILKIGVDGKVFQYIDDMLHLDAATHGALVADLWKIFFPGYEAFSGVIKELAEGQVSAVISKYKTCDPGCKSTRIPQPLVKRQIAHILARALARQLKKDAGIWFKTDKTWVVPDQKDLDPQKQRQNSKAVHRYIADVMVLPKKERADVELLLQLFFNVSDKSSLDTVFDGDDSRSGKCMSLIAKRIMAPVSDDCSTSAVADVADLHSSTFDDMDWRELVIRTMFFEPLKASLANELTSWQLLVKNGKLSASELDERLRGIKKSLGRSAFKLVGINALEGVLKNAGVTI